MRRKPQVFGHTDMDDTVVSAPDRPRIDPSITRRAVVAVDLVLRVGCPAASQHCAQAERIAISLPRVALIDQARPRNRGAHRRRPRGRQVIARIPVGRRRTRRVQRAASRMPRLHQGSRADATMPPRSPPAPLRVASWTRATDQGQPENRHFQAQCQRRVAARPRRRRFVPGAPEVHRAELGLRRAANQGSALHLLRPVLPQLRSTANSTPPSSDERPRWWKGVRRSGGNAPAVFVSQGTRWRRSVIESVSDFFQKRCCAAVEVADRRSTTR